MYYIGIDPGFKGIITILDSEGKVVLSKPTPIVEITGKSIKHWYNVKEIIECLKQYTPGIVVLEKQTVISGQGLVTSGRIMRGFGLWEGILTCIYNNVYIIDPKKWQNYLYKKYVKIDIQNKFAMNDYKYIVDSINDEQFKIWYEKYISNKSTGPGKAKSSYIYYEIKNKINIYNNIDFKYKTKFNTLTNG